MTLKGAIFMLLSGAAFSLSGLMDDMSVLEQLALFAGLGLFVEGWLQD